MKRKSLPLKAKEIILNYSEDKNEEIFISEVILNLFNVFLKNLRLVIVTAMFFWEHFLFI